jgi:hypothetical protein
MPIFRKIPAEAAAAWEDQHHTIDATALLDTVGIADRRGLTRIDRGGAAGGEHAWRARVYVGGGEHHRQFADSLHGGPVGALNAAIAWRDAVRKQVAVEPRPRLRRILRVERPDWGNVGYFAWRTGQRRYFSDARYGGSRGAQTAAEAWAAGENMNLERER